MAVQKSHIVSIRRALISVSDKTHVAAFANFLHEQGVEIISTGGTATLLQSEGIPVTSISEVTEFPEMMDGRVKTLHPRVHGGLLGRKGEDDVIMNEHGINPIDLLVVNLYPFQETITKANVTLVDAVENIDIGGPAMLRSGAKNFERVTVLTDPADYDVVKKEIARHQGVSYSTRCHLAAKVYAHTAKYDAQIAQYLGQVFADETEDKADDKSDQEKNKSYQVLPDIFIESFQRRTALRYGENPHQIAGLYTLLNAEEAGVARAVLLQGKALSYNNLVDADAAVASVFSFEETACAIIKHANPCGVAEGNNMLDVYNKAYACDPTSAFGGIIAFNRHLDEVTATEIMKRQFVEVIIAPSVSSAALNVLSEKANVRVLALGENFTLPRSRLLLKRITGGLLVQSSDDETIAKENLRIVSQREPTTKELHDLLFAWKVVKHVKSNAIVYAKNRMTLGIGCGQTSRVHSALLATIKADEQDLDLSGSVMASDAFFPFRDGIDKAAERGIRAVIHPGGSIRDEEVISAANEHEMAMILTGVRHFNH